MKSSNLRIAWRNLGRNRKRTAFALSAIALGQMMVVSINGMMAGMFQDMMETITGPLLGHVQIHQQDWREERAIDIYLSDLDVTIAALRDIPEVTRISPRIYSAVLAASGKITGQPANAEPAMIVGVDMEVESAPGGLLAKLASGQYPKGRDVVLGKTLARRLGLGPGDEIAVIGQDADEFPVSDLFRVSAILSGSVDLVNRLGVVMPLETAQEFLTLENSAHELVIQGKDHRDAGVLAATVAALETLGGAEVLSWTEAAPELARMIGIKAWFDLVFVGILFVAAAAGIANTMMMSTFERSHEFGMLLALGTGPRRIVSMIMLEAVVLGLVGVAIGSVVGTTIVLITGQTGINYAALSGIEDAEVSYHGLTLSYMMYPIFEFRHIVYGAVAVTLTSILASIWPAAVAARLQPAEAMRT